MCWAMLAEETGLLQPTQFDANGGTRPTAVVAHALDSSRWSVFVAATSQHSGAVSGSCVGHHFALRYFDRKRFREKRT